MNVGTVTENEDGSGAEGANGVINSKKRSRNGCLICRNRKVKCDEVRDRCGPCTSLQLDCTWHIDMSSIVSPGGSSKRPRGRSKGTACRPCRQSKARCDRTDPEAACERCKSMNIECIMLAPSSNLAEGPETADAPVIRYKAPSPTTLIDIIDIYFVQVQLSDGVEFLHRGDFMRDFVDGTVPSPLMQSILLVSGRFLPSANKENVDGGEDLAKLATDLKMWILAETDKFSMLKLVVLLNIRMHEQYAGRHGSSWLLVSLIARMAYAMGLNTDRNDASTNENETRRRTMWAVYAMDSNAAGGIEEYTLTNRRTIRISLPVSERAFALGVAVLGRSLDEVEFDPVVGPENTEGLASRHVRLQSLRNDILSYTKYIKDYTAYAWQPESRFDLICQKLRCWHSSLPTDLQFNIECLYALKGQAGALCNLACAHIWYDQLHSTLYRMAFPGFDESAPLDYLAQAPLEWIDKLRRGCYHRAIEVRQKIRFLAKHSLYVESGGFRMSGFVYECIRNQLAFIKYAYPEGEPPLEHGETAKGFEDLVAFLLRCSPSPALVRAPLRRIFAMISRHGYTMGRDYAIVGPETRPASPGQGPVLERLPYMHGIMRHPNVKLQSTPRRPEESGQSIDPVTEGPLSHSPARSSSQFQQSPAQLEPMYGDPLGVFADLFREPGPSIAAPDQSTTGTWAGTDNAFLVGNGLDAWFDDWTAQIPIDGTTDPSDSNLLTEI